MRTYRDTTVPFCPKCGGEVSTERLYCESCDIDFCGECSLPRYVYLNNDEHEFLECFLREEGNLTSVKKSMGISTQEAKKRLRHILSVLKIEKREEENTLIDVSEERPVLSSNKASDIIRNLLITGGGKATVYSQTGRSQYTIMLTKGKDSEIGDSFFCDKLKPKKIYELRIFDIIVDLLKEEGGKAFKGNGREFKVGYGGCTYDTVAGRIGVDYFNKSEGESTLDPVFVLNAIMLWAGVCQLTTPGCMELSSSYRATLGI